MSLENIELNFEVAYFHSFSWPYKVDGKTGQWQWAHLTNVYLDRTHVTIQNNVFYKWVQHARVTQVMVLACYRKNPWNVHHLSYFKYQPNVVQSFLFSKKFSNCWMRFIYFPQVCTRLGWQLTKVPKWMPTINFLYKIKNIGWPLSCCKASWFLLTLNLALKLVIPMV